MTTISIINQTIETVNDYLTLKLQTEVDKNDPTYAGLVRPGLLQDDPTRKHINILTFPNDPDTEGSWKHEIIDRNPNGLENPPAYEIGGNEMWYRRFTTKLEMFLPTNIKRDDSRILASIILARAEHSLSTISIQPIGTDDFGETAIRLYVIGSELTQGGGDGQFIWYGKVWYQLLTGKELRIIN